MNVFNKNHNYCYIDACFLLSLNVGVATAVNVDDPPDKNDIHGELQYYLTTNNVNQIIVALVEHVLTDKPVNPHGFTIEYLYSTYPILAKEAVDRINTKAGVKLE